MEENFLVVIALAIIMITGAAATAVVVPVRAAESSAGESTSTSNTDNDKGSSASEDNAEKQATLNNPDPDKDKDNDLSPTTTTETPTNPNPNPNPEQPVTGAGETTKPITPNTPTTTTPPVITSQPSQPPEKTTTTPTTTGNEPDQSCLFHPEQAKCKSDNGKCPTGFNQNEDGNCFPKHDKCPKGFHGHEDDETGRCISDKIPCQEGYIRDPNFPQCSSKSFLCKDHPELRGCGGKDGGGPRTTPQQHITIILKIIHTHDSGKGYRGSHGLSDACYLIIKQTWLGNIHIGQNAEIDKFMERCLV